MNISLLRSRSSGSDGGSKGNRPSNHNICPQPRILPPLRQHRNCGAKPGGWNILDDSQMTSRTKSRERIGFEAELGGDVDEEYGLLPTLPQSVQKKQIGSSQAGDLV